MKRLGTILGCGLVMIAWTGALANPIPEIMPEEAAPWARWTPPVPGVWR